MKEVYITEKEEKSYQEKFQQVVDEICENQKDEDKADQIRKFLGEIDIEEMLESVIDGADGIPSSYSYVLGFVFEHLARKEFVEKNRLAKIDRFIQRIMQRPELLGIELKRKPDFFVIKEQGGKVVVTGIVEVKTGKIKEAQLLQIYGEVKHVVDKINDFLLEIKAGFDLEGLPEEGITLLPEDEIDKLLVSPRDIYKDNWLIKEIGWRRKKSMLSIKNVRKIASVVSEELSVPDVYHLNKSLIEKTEPENEVAKGSAPEVSRTIDIESPKSVKVRISGEFFDVLNISKVGDLKVGDKYEVLPGKKLVDQMQTAKEIKIAAFLPDNRLLLITDTGFTMRTRLSKLDRSFNKVE